MRNNVEWAGGDYWDNPVYVMGMVLSVVVFIMGFGIGPDTNIFGYIIPWIISVALMTPEYLWLTSSYRGMNADQHRLWYRYVSLPKELRNDVHLDRAQVLAMTNSQCDNLRAKLRTLDVQYADAENARAEIGGSVKEISDRIDTLIMAHSTDAETYREIARELQ